MYAKMMFVVATMLLEIYPRWQLGCFSALALVMLALVIIDVPYRCPDGDHGDVTHGDWHMVLSQILLLLSYGLAALCLVHAESRSEKGQEGLDPVVELFAALAGFLILSVQLGSLIPRVGTCLEACLSKCVGPLMVASRNSTGATIQDSEDVQRVTTNPLRSTAADSSSDSSSADAAASSAPTGGSTADVYDGRTVEL
jgi:hypothetical protein